MVDKPVWVLGERVQKADKCISWGDPIPNLSNCDYLIINLEDYPFPYPDSQDITEILKYIFILMMTHNTHIFIILPINLKSPGFLPVFPMMHKIQPVAYHTVQSNQVSKIPDIIYEYCALVENCHFFLSELNSNNFNTLLNPKSTQFIPYPFSHDIKNILIHEEYTIKNKAGQPIGSGIYYSFSDANKIHLHTTGTVHFLPPPTKKTPREAVQFLVNFIYGTEFTEDEPSWISKVVLPKAGNLNNIINEKKEQIEKLNNEIADIEIEKKDIEKHLRLLWTDGTPLEEAVKDALFLLGFYEIKPGRARDLEDWVIDIKSNDDIKQGVIEVKGSKKSISMDDIGQCNKWVTQYRAKLNLKVKGILIPNQYRRTYKLDSKRRTKFASNQIDWARDIDVCILPTAEIFKAVIYNLKGEEIKREEIERRILEADPICSLVD